MHGLAVSLMALSAPAFAADKNPSHVYWGDQHVHTGWSADAGLAGTSLGPDDAVRFARGEAVKSTTGDIAQLHRALDWIALTDHSDGMGTINNIREGHPEMMADPTVKRWHDLMAEGPEGGMTAAREAINAQATKTLPKEIMNPKWMISAWQKTVDVMEKYNEPGKFTALIGYEWTSNGEVGQNLHRNVIFRDGADKTRATPPLTTFVSALDGHAGTDPESLWTWLAKWEEKSGGKVLAIPHNGNLSNGWMFAENKYDGSPLTADWAATRARWEPVVEIFQYKGSSEAHPALSPSDEFAGYELWDSGDLNGNAKKPEDLKTEYAREALKRGLVLEEKFGANPFKFGMVSGSDTHTGLATGGEENNFWGKFISTQPQKGRWDITFKKEEKYLRKNWTFSAQGLTGVWARENTRGEIWDSLKRKEVYASTGPRISLRFFAGYDFDKADTTGDVATIGYAKGVPMGGDLAKAPVGKVPTFLIAALKDPEGANLDRVQVVKGWVDAKGETHEKIFDVMWSGDRKPDASGKLPPVGNTVDVKTARYTNAIGAGQFVGIFTDPDFDATQKAFYYARVIEIPTPRWTDYDVANYKDNIPNPIPLVIQERAVSSPVWYTPEAKS